MSQKASIGQNEPGRLPDWLRSMEGAEQIPDWLRRLAQVEEETWDTVAPQPFSQETAQTEKAVGFDNESFTQADEFGAEIQVPEWFADIEETAVEPAAAAGDLFEGIPEGESPEWLADFARPEASKTPFESLPQQGEPEIPAWLSGLETAAIPGASPQAPSETPPEELPMPDWLLGLEESAPVRPATQPESTEIPSWLLGVSEPEPVSGPETQLPDRLTAEVPQKTVESEATELPDWLRPAVETGAEIPAAEETLELPGWLAAEGPRKAIEPEATELPDWLRSAVETGAEIPAAEETLELPGWLKQIVSEGETTPAQQTGISQPFEEQETPPDWLAQLESPAPTVETPLEPETDTSLPDWLHDLGEIPSATKSRVIGTDWLRKIEETPLPPEPLAEQEPTETVPAPDWLGALDWNEPAQARPTPPSAGLPDWLGQVEESEPGEHELVGLTDQALSPELSELEQEIRLIAAQTGLRPAAEDDLAWIDKQRTQTEPVNDPALPVETSGPLAGLRGLLNPEPLLGLFPKSVYRPAQPTPDAHVAAAKLFETILSAPPAGPTVVEHTQAKEALASLGRWFIYITLLAVMILAAFLPRPFNELIRAPEMLETTGFYAAVERLPQDSIVLLALDYDAALDGELTPQARAIVHHLAQRGIGMVAVSLTPQGSAIIEELFAQEGNLVAGQNYLNLGYLPPHPASLQALIDRPLNALTAGLQIDLATTSLGSRVTDLNEIDLIVTISGSVDHVRWWIEQVGTRYGIDIVAGVSAATAPYVLPYYQGDYGQIKGLLIGLAGAADYERKLTGGTPLDYAQRNLALQGYGQLVMVMILLLSGITLVLKRRA